MTHLFMHERTSTFRFISKLRTLIKRKQKTDAKKETQEKRQMAKFASYFDPHTPNVVLKSLFMKYDKDNNGYLTRDELNGLLVDDLGLTDSQAHVYSHLLDRDGDAKISFDEFEKWLRSGEKLKNIGNKSRYARLQRAVTIFQKYDVDGNQSLDRQEFEKLFYDCGGRQGRVSQGLSVLDKDGDGKISFLEFLRWLNWVPLDTFE